MLLRALPVLSQVYPSHLTSRAPGNASTRRAELCCSLPQVCCASQLKLASSVRACGSTATKNPHHKNVDHLLNAGSASAVCAGRPELRCLKRGATNRHGFTLRRAICCKVREERTHLHYFLVDSEDTVIEQKLHGSAGVNFVVASTACGGGKVHNEAAAEESEAGCVVVRSVSMLPLFLRVGCRWGSGCLRWAGMTTVQYCAS